MFKTGDLIFHCVRGFGMYIKPLPNNMATVKFDCDPDFDFDEVSESNLILIETYEALKNPLGDH